MVNRGAALFGLLFLIVTAGCGDARPQQLQSVAPEKVGLSPARLERLTTAMQAHIDAGRLAGVIGVVARHGQVAYFRPLGMQDRESGVPMRRDTIVGIASMTKPIVSVGLMALYEQGRVLVTDPVSRYLPEFAHAEVALEQVDPETGKRALARVPIEREMTVKDLLMHTSGLTSGFLEDGPVDRLYASIERESVTLEQFTQNVAKLPLKHQPGTAWEYGLSTDVLGRLVEVLSGQPLDEFLAERVLGPLEMVDSGFWVPESTQGRLARMYAPADGGGIRPDDDRRARYTREPLLLSGAGGMVSTADDYLRFAQMLLNGGELDGARILGRKTVEWMTQDHLGDLPGPKFYPGYGFGLGFGVRRDVSGPGTTGSVGTYNWAGAGGTYFWVDPEEQLIGIFITQFMPGWNRYAREFEVLTYQAIVR